MFHLKQVVLTMTINKQSEKREAQIMVIEGKTLKTLTKKENKMNNKMNYSLNKTIKSVTDNKKFPKYELQKNSDLEIDLPNGMELSISATKCGKYCTISVRNFVKNYSTPERGTFKMNVENKSYDHSKKGFSCKTDSIIYNNYESVFNGGDDEATIDSALRFELKEFNRNFK